MPLPLLLIAGLMGSVFILPMAMDSVLGLALLYFVARDPGLHQKWRTLAEDPLGKVALLFIVYLCLSVLWSTQWQWQDLVQTWMRALLCFCVILTLANTDLENNGFLQLVARIVAVCVILSVSIAILKWLQDMPSDGRLCGLFRLNNAGKAGRMYAAAMPVLLVASVVQQRLWKTIAIIGLIMAGLAVLLTDTRAAWLGALAGVGTCLLATARPRARDFYTVGAALALLSLLALLALVLHPDPAVRGILLPRGDSFRLQIWSDHMQYILQTAPLIGDGYLSRLEMDLGEVSTTGAHSMYLSNALQGGLLGLALFLTITVWAALRLSRHLHLPMARLALSLLFCGAVVYVFNGDRLLDKFNFAWYVSWIPVAIAIALKTERAPGTTMNTGN